MIKNKDKVRNINKLKIRMAKWLGLSGSKFNLKICDYVEIAKGRRQLYQRMFNKCFAWQVEEIAKFESDKQKLK